MAETRQAAHLANKTVLISGAGGGIGSAIARRLHADGARIVAMDIAAERVNKLTAELPGSVAVIADSSSPAGADVALAAAGSIDILINNAGIADGGAAVDELEDARWTRVIEVNMTSAFLLSRRAVPSMLAKGQGVIVNMSSVAGLRGGRTGIAYTASKWALVGMAANIAAMYGAEGIRAYAICPAGVSGAIGLAEIAPTPRALKNRGRDTQRPDLTSPEDVAELAAFLVSEKARHINGIAVPLDRGWLAF